MYQKVEGRGGGGGGGGVFGGMRKNRRGAPTKKWGSNDLR
jgi:hypothetical protein